MKREEITAKFVTRKFLAATATAALMAICWVLCQFLPLARDYFGTLITGLTGVLTAYVAGNVAQDHVLRNVRREEHVEATTVTRTTSQTPAPQPSQAQPPPERVEPDQQ